MRSMTGFGRAELEGRGVRVSAEVRSWNQRFLEVRLLLPRGWAAWETELRKLVQRYVNRGRVEVSIRLEHIKPKPFRLIVNLELARRYVDEIRKLARLLKLNGSISAESLLRLPEIFVVEEEASDRHAQLNLGYRVLKKALLALDRERKREGRSLERDFAQRIVRLRSAALEAKRLAARAQKASAENFKNRLRALMDDASVDQKRLFEEAASLAQRGDVSEEIVRLIEHLRALSDLVRRNAPVGKEIDFILQELNREANTIGAKSQDISLSRLVIQMKGEIEKMREQVQNVE